MWHFLLNLAGNYANMKNGKNLNRVQELYQNCIFGGNIERIKRLVSENDYTIKELMQAVEVLKESVTSALENNVAGDSIEFLNKIIEGKKLLQKITK